jgi:hypothetical protein
MYIERQTGPAWLRLTGAAAAAVVAAAAVLLIPAIIRTWGTASTGVLVAALIALIAIVGLAAVTGLLASISVRVQNGEVVARLTPFRVFAIPVEDIIGTGQAQVSPADAGGIGYRLKPGKRFLLFDGGAAVRLETREGRTYFIRSDRGPEMVDSIAQARSTQI